jgi:uncharacterized membrane protein YphA (DoxX/SURF4 family)
LGIAQGWLTLSRVQRLFATFPDGQPGAALLLLRLSLAGVLAFHGSAYWPAQPPFWSTVISSGVGILLAIGLFTPFAAIGGAAVGVIVLFLCRGCDPLTGAFVVIVMAALGMLGAGAYSLDARMYGRREVVVPTRHEG